MPTSAAQVSLSVVVASHDASTTIAGCLCALGAQPGRERLEVIVADSSTDGTDEIVRQRFPEVTLLHFSEPLSVPQLRGRGIAVARAEIIAVIDPYSIVDTRWLPALLEAHAVRPNRIIGGAVDLDDADRQSLSAWSSYLWEYGRFMSPVREGPVDILPGSNISYKRPALGEIARMERDGFWKTFVNQDVAADDPLWLAPGVRVSLRKPIPLVDFLRTRYDHGRCFAGMRSARASWWHRLCRAVTTPLLPGVLWWRVARVFWPKRRHRARFALTTPTQVLLFVWWSWGELWGYTRGCGRSCDRLYY